MNPELLKLLACPKCAGELALDQSVANSGTTSLMCQQCQSSFDIVNGVPRLNESVAEHQLASVAATFGFEWTAHHEGAFETDTLFGRTRDQDWTMVTEGMRITDTDVKGAIVLDAGCGSGRFCQLFADHGAELVIGVDMIDSIDQAAESCRDYDNVHILQANIFALPFKHNVFDLVWCNGVIHHTPDAAGAHRSLAKHVRHGGVLYVWVYAARFNPFRFVKSISRSLQLHRWRPPVLQRLAGAMAYASLPALALYRLIRSAPRLRPRTSSGKRTVRARRLDELKLTWFDALSPEFDTRHTEEEVIGWFRDLEFSEIHVLDEPKVGVRGVAGEAQMRG